MLCSRPYEDLVAFRCRQEPSVSVQTAISGLPWTSSISQSDGGCPPPQLRVFRTMMANCDACAGLTSRQTARQTTSRTLLKRPHTTWDVSTIAQRRWPRLEPGSHRRVLVVELPYS